MRRSSHCIGQRTSSGLAQLKGSREMILIGTQKKRETEKFGGKHKQLVFFLIMCIFLYEKQTLNQPQDAL